MATTPYPFVASTVLTASQLNSTFNIPVSTKTANYVLTAADAGTRVVMNAAGATTITVNTSLFSAGDNLQISNIGAGVTTVTAGTATVSSAGPLAIPQYGGGTLYFTSAGVSIFFPSAGPAATSALTFIAGQTLSSSSTTFSNCFSATYDSYYASFSNLPSLGVNIRLSLGSGTNHTYNLRNITPGGSDSNLVSGTNQNFFTIGTLDNVCNGIIQFVSPFLTCPTFVNAQSSNGNQFMMCQGNETSSTSFSNMTFTAPASSWTGGVVKIYGYSTS